MAQVELKKSNSNLSFSSVDEMLNNADASITEKIAAAEGFTQPFRGSLEMIIGPMFAGKSTELLRRMDRQCFSGKRCLYIKYSEDTRYNKDCISTHDQ